MRGLGYRYVLATVKADNYVEIYMLETDGWIRLASFINPETGNQLLLMGKDVYDDSRGQVSDQERRSLPLAI